MAKNNVGKKPISQEEYTTNKVLAVFSVCLLGVLVLMILERLLGYSNTWKTGVLVTRVLLGVGIVGAAAGIIMLGQEHAGKRSSVRRIVCGRNMLIASIVADQGDVCCPAGSGSVLSGVSFLCAGIFPDCSRYRCGCCGNAGDSSRAGFG